MFIIFLSLLTFICRGNLVNSCPIYLTIASNGKTLQESNLELNWPPDCYTRPEWIGFYGDNPAISNTTFKMPIKQKLGKCLNYCVASFNGNELLAVECLKIYRNWLTKLPNIRKLPLKDLFIPGTHASGAYITDYIKTKSFFIKDYAASLHFDVWSQLVFGIRYLDLSIGYKTQDNTDLKNADHFWIVNENMFINQLRYILKDIRRFANISGEVVIIDFSSFPVSFYKHPERHSELLNMLKNELGSLAYQRNTSMNSEKLLTSKERASRINPKVANWLKGPWGSTANVVAMDYFSSTNLIDMAIYSNLQEAFMGTNRKIILKVMATKMLRAYKNRYQIGYRLSAIAMRLQREK
uniref:Phosphatidylinositol-specific phospholipase C X domain-containing protein n=1 Tax=Glossina pallidipes TaxID=7398 RepID=A0A1B0A2E1_GLOPL